MSKAIPHDPDTSSMQDVPTIRDEFDFSDLAPKFKEVKYDGKRFIMREASEDAAVKYQNAAVRAAKMVDGKVTCMDGVAETEPILVSCCLFEINENAGPHEVKERPVMLATIKRWPAAIVKKLFIWIKENSDIGDKLTEEALTKQFDASVEALSKLTDGDLQARKDKLLTTLNERFDVMLASRNGVAAKNDADMLATTAT